MTLTLKDHRYPSVLAKWIWVVLICGGLSCQPAQDQAVQSAGNEAIDHNPPAEGFDITNSDQQAIEIADKVMEAMGGRQAWDHTRFLSWDFFGARRLVWDKQTGNVRIDFPDSTVYLVNINDTTGKAFKDGEEVTHPDSLTIEMNRARRIWINDSYWLVMPFKLKDSGVTLKHLGLDETQQGVSSHLLELTFNQVGVTPENRYLVYVDTSTNLVNQWAFYREADQDSANFILPWANYQQFGDILLSGNRGDRELTDITVYDSLPDQVFTSLEEVDLSIYN